MSFDPETTRIVRSWMDEGATQLPDRVLDAVLDQLPSTPQSRATWWPARRISTVNAIVKFGVAAAVLVVAALIGINYFGGSSGVGGPGGVDSTPSAEPTPEVTPEPTAEPTPDPTPAGLLPVGPHVLVDGTEETATVRVTVTIPAPDWYGEPGDGILIKNDQSGAPDGAGLIVFAGQDLYVYGDPCRWSTTRPEEPATTVDELVDALAAQALRDATEPVDVTVDGYSGKSITLHVPEDADFSECDRSTFGSWGVSGPDESPFRYHQDPGQIDKLWILDVEGELVVIDTAHYEGTPQSVVDELDAIVESATFEAS